MEEKSAKRSDAIKSGDWAWANFAGDLYATNVSVTTFLDGISTASTAKVISDIDAGGNHQTHIIYQLP